MTELGSSFTSTSGPPKPHRPAHAFPIRVWGEAVRAVWRVVSKDRDEEKQAKLGRSAEITAAPQPI